MKTNTITNTYSNFRNFKKFMKKLHLKIVPVIITLGITNSAINAYTKNNHKTVSKYVSQVICRSIENHVGAIPNNMLAPFAMHSSQLFNKKVYEYQKNNRVLQGIYEMTQVLLDKKLYTAPGGALKIIVSGFTAIRLKAEMIRRRVIMPPGTLTLNLPEMRHRLLSCLYSLDQKLPFNSNNQINFNFKNNN